MLLFSVSVWRTTFFIRGMPRYRQLVALRDSTDIGNPSSTSSIRNRDLSAAA